MNTLTPVKAMAAKTPAKPDERSIAASPAPESKPVKPKQKAKPAGMSTHKGTPEAQTGCADP